MLFTESLSVLVLVSSAVGFGSLPPIGEDINAPDFPICTSHSTLCHLAYNFTHHGAAMHNEQQLCRCTGNRQCETRWDQRDNSIIKVFKNSGQEMMVKMTYCQLQQSARVCRKNEPTVVLRGRGAFLFNIESDFQCRCYRQMYAHRSWKQGDLDYIEYSCGKPRCTHNNRQRNPVCTTITYDGSEYNLRHEYLCRCRRNEECNTGGLPTETNPRVSRTCSRVPNIWV